MRYLLSNAKWRRILRSSSPIWKLEWPVLYPFWSIRFSRSSSSSDDSLSISNRREEREEEDWREVVWELWDIKQAKLELKSEGRGEKR